MPEYSAALKRLRTQVSWLVKSNNFNEQITRKSVYFESDSFKQVEKSKIKVGKVELIYHFWKLSIFPEFWATVRLDWGAHLKFDFLIEFVAFFWWISIPFQTVKPSWIQQAPFFSTSQFINAKSGNAGIRAYHRNYLGKIWKKAGNSASRIVIDWVFIRLSVYFLVISWFIVVGLFLLKLWML